MMQILDNAKKKKIIEQLSYLGIEKIPYLLVRIGRERIRTYSGSLAREEISKAVQLLSVEGIGLYFAKEMEDGIRLSTDALHLLKNQIKGNVVEIDDKQEELWFKGKNIELTLEQQKEYGDFAGYVAMKSGEDFIGTGKISQDKKMISNFLPKERRIRNSGS
jgi:NOL1/NOP2/fmu family ribosome biogenesis protein